MLILREHVSCISFIFSILLLSLIVLGDIGIEFLILQASQLLQHLLTKLRVFNLLQSGAHERVDGEQYREDAILNDDHLVERFARVALQLEEGVRDEDGHN